MNTKMSINRLALSNLRVRQRQYLSLTMGIMMTVFFVSVILLAGQGILQSSVIRYQRQIGRQDAILFDANRVNDQVLLSSGFVSAIGNVRVIEQETRTGMTIGSYDETAEALMLRRMAEGRMPVASGEIAIEQDALYRMDQGGKVGDQLVMGVKAINSPNEAEEKAYTIVGILFPQVIMQNGGGVNRISGNSLPRALVSPMEEAALGGRPEIHKLIVYGRGVSVKAFDNYLEHEYGNKFGIDHFGFRLVEDSHSTISAFSLIFLTAVLGTLLVLSACMAVSTSFSGMLAERRNQIGMMRAVGATHRQIIRIFSQEALILALLTAPAGIALSMLAIKGASLVTGDMLEFPNSLWFIPATLLITLAAVMLSVLIPLWSYKGLPPMQIIRDSGLLRSKRRIRIKEQETYKVPVMLAKRHLQLYRLRQFGITLTLALSFVVLTFGFTAMFTESRNSGHRRSDFELGGVGYAYEGFFDISAYLPVISEADAVDISRLPYIEQIEASKALSVNLLRDQVSDYLIKSGFRLYLGDGSNSMNVDFVYQDYERKRYEEVRRQQNIQNHLVEVPLKVYGESFIQGLQGRVLKGGIDLEAINAGREILVFSPDKLYVGWRKQSNGLKTFQADFQPEDDDSVEYTDILENDQFLAGDSLSFIRLTKDHTYRHGGPNDFLEGVIRSDHAAEIGAILRAEQGNEAWIAHETGTLITSVKGLEALGINGIGFDNIKVRLLPSAPPAAREYARAVLNDIVMRSEGISILDSEMDVRDARKWAEIINMAALAIMIVFFMMVVNFVSSAMTMRIKSEKRAIGTLRAVGAQVQDILRSYRLQVWMMLSSGVVIGLLITAGIYFAFIKNNKYSYLTVPFPILFVIQFAFIGLLSLVCSMLLSARLHQMTSVSIVDNIREL